MQPFTAMSMPTWRQPVVDGWSDRGGCGV